MSVPSEGITPDQGSGVSPYRSVQKENVPAKSVTIADVARAAGVSQGAISSMLNERTYGIRVSPDTRERVFRLCREFGYIPNDLRAVVRIYPELGETCLLVSDKIPGGIANPSVARLSSSLMAHSARRPSCLSVILYDEACEYGADVELPAPLAHGIVSKVVCVGGENSSICRVLHARGLPVILLGRCTRAPGTTSIVPDYAAAAKLAVGLLAGHGHSHVGIVDGPAGGLDERYVEMKRAIDDAASGVGIAIHAGDVFSGNLTFEDGAAAVRQMVGRPSKPTALICLAEAAASGVLAGAHGAGLRVPDQLSVVTFADHGGAIDSCIPVSAVVLPADEIASLAVAEAERQLRDGIPVEAAKITVGVRLIERDTTGAAAV